MAEYTPVDHDPFEADRLDAQARARASMGYANNTEKIRAGLGLGPLPQGELKQVDHDPFEDGGPTEIRHQGMTLRPVEHQPEF